ncbi:hypothetical protein HGM15179_002991, partial [Zosterops borbonicus]
AWLLPSQRPLYAVLGLAVKGGTEINLDLSQLKEFHSLRNELSCIAFTNTWLQ